MCVNFEKFLRTLFWQNTSEEAHVEPNQADKTPFEKENYL